MEIPRFSALPGSKIEIEVNGKTIVMGVSHAERGQDDHKFIVKMEGLVQTEPNLHASCHGFFNGQKIAGNLRVVGESDGFSRVSFETIVLDPDFWA